MSSNVAQTTQPPRAVATPCVKVCVVDGASGLCLGCWRTLSEIGGWSGFTDAERARIMGELGGRTERWGMRDEGLGMRDSTDGAAGGDPAMKAKADAPHP